MSSIVIHHVHSAGEEVPHHEGFEDAQWVSAQCISVDGSSPTIGQVRWDIAVESVRTHKLCNSPTALATIAAC